MCKGGDLRTLWGTRAPGSAARSSWLGTGIRALLGCPGSWLREGRGLAGKQGGSTAPGMGRPLATCEKPTWLSLDSPQALETWDLKALVLLVLMGEMGTHLQA